MRKSYWSFVWGTFLKINGFLLGVGGIVVSLLIWVFKSDSNIPLKIIIPLSFFILLILILFIVASYEAYNTSTVRLPKLIFVKNVNSTIDGESTVLLLEPSELFSFESYVSLYFTFEEGFEQLIALGTVINIQQDKKIQVSLVYLLDEHRDILLKLVNNDASVIKHVIIKPNIPRPYFQLLNSKGV